MQQVRSYPSQRNLHSRTWPVGQHDSMGLPNSEEANQTATSMQPRLVTVTKAVELPGHQATSASSS